MTSLEERKPLGKYFSSLMSLSFHFPILLLKNRNLNRCQSVVSFGVADIFLSRMREKKNIFTQKFSLTAGLFEPCAKGITSATWSSQEETRNVTQFFLHLNEKWEKKTLGLPVGLFSGLPSSIHSQKFHLILRSLTANFHREQCFGGQQEAHLKWKQKNIQMSKFTNMFGRNRFEGLIHRWKNRQRNPVLNPNQRTVKSVVGWFHFGSFSSRIS